MGNASMNGRQGVSQKQDQQNVRGNTLLDLPETFNNLYKQVFAVLHATRAQEMLVDGLSNINSDSADEDYKKMKREVDILKEIQSDRSIQCRLLDDSMKDLYKTIICILEENELPLFEINSNNQENSPEYMNKVGPGLKQGQFVQSNDDGQMENYSQQGNPVNADSKMSSKAESSRNKDLREQVSRLEKTVKQLQSQNETLKQEVSKLRPPEGIGTVQLFHSHGGNTIKKIEADLKEMLKMHANQVKLKMCNILDDVDHSKALVILSIITSRVGTDATNAIKDIKNPAKTALVLIHIKEDHALPKQASSAILTGDTFTALGGIYDIGFMHGKGIYPCAMNDDALEGICSFIKQSKGDTTV